MANEAQGSAVVDPLVNYWGLSLFPQTSSVLPDASKPYNPDLDLGTIHNHLRSMALRSPSKLLEQAKSIIDGNPGTGLFNSEVLGDSASYEINNVVSEEAMENPRERRPALGHKRARFSLKPNKIHPTEILKPSLDIDDLKDPEEFFMAHERLENAKREIQKQMGNVLFESNQYNISTNARQRRPGLLGNNQRRSVKYKHRYSVETSDNKGNVPSSQETFESGGLVPVDESPEKAEACLASVRSELAESSAMKENNLNNILNELLHSSEDLEEDQAITLLQESLQIKPIVLEKLSIPDLPDNRVTELKTFGGNLPKPRKPLMNIDNLLKEMNNVTPVKLRQEVGNPLQQIASPTPPKSPFALLPSLQKHISQSRPSVDPFSALDSDNLSTRNSSQTDMTKQGLNLVDSGKPSDKLTEPLVKDIKSSVEETVRNFMTTEKSKEDNSREPALGTNIDSTESHVDIEVDTGDRNMGNKAIDDIVRRPSSEVNEPCKFKEDTVRTCESTSKICMEDNSTEPTFGTNVDSNKSHVDMEVDVGGSDVGNRIVDDKISRKNYEANVPCKFKVDTVRTCADNSKEDNSKEPAFGTNVDSNISQVDMEVDVGGSDVDNRFVHDTISRANEPNEFVDKVQEVVASAQTDEPALNLVNPLDQSNCAWFEANSVDGNTRTSDDGPEQCLQVQENTGDSQVPVNEPMKAKSRKRKDKGLSRRQSLAVAGTSWEAGVRRSTRIRSRPLEYWKGERPVYGRIHESLATVIGVKYMSPGTADGKPTMKVKSYVAEKYKELLELASQY